MPGLSHRRVVVDVPATSANLGAGYDSLAVALEIANRIEVEALDEPSIDVSVEGEGADALPRSRENRFVVALERGLQDVLGEVPAPVGWRVRMWNQVPLMRGLGSSATATVGGLVAANALAGRTLERHRLLALAAELEGHPDNAAAALLGGFVAVALVHGSPAAVRIDPGPGLGVVLYVPKMTLSTADMRAVLPRAVPHADAVFNVGRVALGVAGLVMQRYELLAALTEDRLHEPYRARAYPALPRLVAAARDAGALGACLSGSGSTVIAFARTSDVAENVAQAMAIAGEAAGLSGRTVVTTPRATGATVADQG